MQIQCNSVAHGSSNKSKFDRSITTGTQNFSRSYIEQFWLGLLEGDGSITVDQNKPWSCSRSRIFISLKNLEKNRTMLYLIQKEIGGRVRIERENKYVTWSAVSNKDVLRAISILDKYPLLTTRKKCQLLFMKECMKNRDVNFYLEKRDSKYESQQKMIALFNENFVLPGYFPAWLSGFIEAEGNFSLYKVGDIIKPKAFSIGQNNDWYILEAIKSYFNSHHKIVKLSKQKTSPGAHRAHGGYRLDMYGIRVRQSLYHHFLAYPLLGDKKRLYTEWISLDKSGIT